MDHPLIQDVSDTALLVAAQRAIETDRRDALFRDPLAKKLAGDRGAAMIAEMPRWARAFSQWTVAIRTALIDDLILASLARGVDTVLNLGAGLDTRPYRMLLPETLHWVEVDVPAMIDRKETLTASEAPRCRLERRKLDLSERDQRQRLFDEIAATSNNVLVLTEGVVPYLTVEACASLADDLRRIPAVRAWIAEYFAPGLVRRRQKLGRRQMKNAPWRFTPDDWFGFFAAHGWVAQEVRYLPEEGRQRGRPVPLPALVAGLIALGRVFMGSKRRNAMKRAVGYVVFAPN